MFFFYHFESLNFKNLEELTETIVVSLQGASIEIENNWLHHIIYLRNEN